MKTHKKKVPLFTINAAAAAAVAVQRGTIRRAIARMVAHESTFSRAWDTSERAIEVADCAGTTEVRVVDLEERTTQFFVYGDGDFKKSGRLRKRFWRRNGFSGKLRILDAELEETYSIKL